MSKRLTDREILFSKLNYLGDPEIEEILDFVSRMETSLRERAQREITDDDLVTMLSSARENCRARQVFEWEAVRRRAEARASTHSTSHR